MTNQLHGVFQRLPQSVGQNRPSESDYKHIEIFLPIKQAQPVIIFELHADKDNNANQSPRRNTPTSDAAPPGICMAIEHASKPGHDIATNDIISDGFTFDTRCYR